MEFIPLLVLIGAGLTIGTPIAAFMAFFRTDKLKTEILRLSLEVQGLRVEVAQLREGPRSSAPFTPPVATELGPVFDVAPPVARPSAEVLPELAPTSPAAEPLAPVWEAPGPEAAPPPLAALESFEAKTNFEAKQSFEERVATRWFVWVAGVAFALGGLFLVRQVWDRPWFGPEARIAAGAALSLALLAAAEWMKRGGVKAFPPLAAPVTAAAGLVALFGVSFAGHAVYALYDPTLAFALLAAIAAGGVALGLRFGAAISVLSLAGAFAVPILVGGEGAHPLVLFTYLGGVSALGLALVALRGWRSAAVTTAIGAVGWAVVWITFASYGQPLWPAAVFIAAHAAAGAWLARQEGPLPLSLTILRGGVEGASARLLIGATFVDLAAPGLAYLSAAGGHVGWTLLAVLAAAVVSFALARWRGAFAVAPLFAALACLMLLAAWPRDSMGAAAEAPLFMAFCLATAATFFAAGLWAAARMRLPSLAHYAAAFAPLGAYALAWQGGIGLSPEAWALIAGAGALVMTATLELLGRARPRPLPQSLYGIAAALFVAAGVTLALEGAQAALGFAAAAFLATLLYSRWGFALLGLAAGLLGARALIGLAFNIGEPFALMGLGPWPGFLITHAGTATLLAACALVARRAQGKASFVAGAFEALALATAMLGLTLALRLALRGSITALSFDLLEAATYVTVWLTTALALRLSGLASRSIVMRIGEVIIAALAVALFVTGCLMHFNPVWGAAPSRVFGPPVFNELLLAYGAPGLIAAIYAGVVNRGGARGQARVLEVVAALALPLWATFETRRAFTGGELNRYGVSAPEQWAYSLVWLACGAALLGVGYARGRRDIRFAALGLIALTIAKVFLLDMADLNGIWRAFSFLALGAVLMAMVFAYQRFILPAERAAAAREKAAAAP